MSNKKLNFGITNRVSFLVSAVSPVQYPPDDCPEVAFAGRSNVGKSSLINCLFHQKNVARTSRTPGCTRQVNFFQVNHPFVWRFVDLPGYGYAVGSGQQRARMGRHIADYLTVRRGLRVVVLLMDIRRGVTELDAFMIAFLEQQALPCLPVVTKSDKLKSNARRHAFSSIASRMADCSSMAVSQPYLCSSRTDAGIPELRVVLNGLLMK